MRDIVAVGSIAYDSIKTPYGEVKNALGGSLTHFVNAASKIKNNISVVGVVGYDFADIDFFKSKNINVTDVKVDKNNKTFYWEGYYEDLDHAITLKTELNSFAYFDPKVSEVNKKTKILFLANIDPEIQYSIMSQVEYKICFLDTMNFWIESKKNSLEKVISKACGIILNEGELFLFTGIKNIKDAVNLLFSKGLKYVVLKRGSNGVMFFSNKGDFFNIPSFFVPYPKDPTGAGDSFAGAFLSYLINSGIDNMIDFETAKKSLVYANIVASFNIEGFGVEMLNKIGIDDIKERYNNYLKYSSIPKLF